MAKNSITDYSNTAASNTDIQSVDIDEGCLPSGINNAIREIMADLADVNDGTVSLTSPAFAAASLTGNLSFGDGNKAIFGAGSDLQIYHDGSNSYIDENGTGNLFIKAEHFYVRDQSNDNLMRALSTGEVNLYHSGSQKLATTSTGIDVTGTVTAEGLTISDDYPQIIFTDTNNNPDWTLIGANGRIGFYDATNAVEVATINSTGIDVNGTVTADGLTVEQNTDSKITLKSTDTAILAGEVIGDIEFYSSDASGVGAGARANITVEAEDAAGRGSMYFKTSTGGESPITRALIQGNGDISFYEDTGTTAKLFWDASEEALGLGTTSPSRPLHIYNAMDTGLYLQSSDAATSMAMADTGGSVLVGQTSGALQFYTGGDANTAGYLATERMRITSAGLVGIGTSLPEGTLHVENVSNNSLIMDAPANRFNSIGFQTAGADKWWLGRADSDIISGDAFFIGKDNGNLTDAGGFSNKLVITQAGSVGIGTSSVYEKLTIGGADETSLTNQIAIRASDNDDIFRIRTNNSTEQVSIEASGDSGNGFMTFGTGSGSAERLRITSAGLVGIGTTSPATYGVDNADDLVIGQGDGNHGITISSYGTSNGTLAFSDQTGATVGRGFVNYDHNVNAMSFGTLSTERMRIDSSGVTTFKYNTKVYTGGYPEIRLGISDSNYFNLVFDNPSDLLSIGKNGSTKMSLTASGNLLVGTTSTDPNSTAGAQLASNGRILATVDGGNAAYFNRLTSDGELVRFEKDGTTVGSIGTASGYSYWAAPANFSLMLVTNDIRPRSVTGSGNNDNSVDIGTSAARFKDLHLGGTAYAGGLDINMSTNARGYFADNIGEVGSGNFALQVVNAAGSALKPLGFRAEDIRFATGSSERMRIDSAGNLMVGKTSATVANDGFTANSAGYVTITDSGFQPLILNRKSNDGIIADFRKDGTTIGSISSLGVRISFEGDAAGISPYQSVIYPTNGTGTAVNNSIDIGHENYAFKDLHLGGTAYAGNVVSQVAINAQTGTAYTTVLTDQSKLVTLTNASAITFTIPANSSVAYPIGTQIDLSQFGAGQVTVAGASGVTVNSASGLKLRAQYSSASCIKVATDTWLLVGDLEVS
jgi:hypothetical protein